MIIGALTSGAIVESTSMTVVLMLPAIVVTVCFFLILFGIERDPGTAGGKFDVIGFCLITDVIGFVMAGLITIRLQGPDSPLAWILIAVGLASLAPFVAYEARQEDPIIDVRLFASPLQWPVQLTAFLFGMSVLGAQIPLSTFARTDPDVAGYGLGADASFVATLIGVYVVFLAIGAFTLPLTTRLLGPRGALILSSLLVALGYALWLPFHDTTTQALVNMAVAGVGSGALVAALPASAAAGAPPERTGFATGMTNATKTIGGAIASSIFAIALASTGSLEDPTEGHAPLSGYLTVWSVCAAAALLAAFSPAADAEGGDERPGRTSRHERSAGVSPRRRSRLGAQLLTGVLGVLGALVLVLAFGRPSVGRFLAAGLLIGAAAVVRYNSLHRDDPGRYGRSAQIRSLVWSVVIVVVFVGVSLLLSQVIDGG